MTMSLEKMLPYLRCPRTGTGLRKTGDSLVSDAGETYPIVDGKPVLVRVVQDFHITPPPAAIISRNTASYKPPAETNSDAICLHLGCGDVPSDDPRVISLDVLPTPSADVVGEAEALPFKSGSLDYVESGAVFEHVFDPIRSAEEVRRVLKEGGEMFIDTAFLQGYHGFPSHYFNMTPQAVETLLCDDFVLEDSYVPDGATVTHVIPTIVDRFLELVPASDRAKLLDRPLSEFLDTLRSSKSRVAGIASQLSEYGHRSLAASFAIRAKKPAGYDPERSGDVRHRAARAAYYAARMGVIQRHHEIELYRRLARESGGDDISFKTPSLNDILSTSKLSSPSDAAAVEASTKRLVEWDGNLKTLRDDVIVIYLQAKAASPVKPA